MFFKQLQIEVEGLAFTATIASYNPEGFFPPAVAKKV